MSSGHESPRTVDADTQSQISRDHQRIGFVGPSGVGKTTVATLVANRLAERTAVEITGDTAAFFDHSSVSGTDLGPLGVRWGVVDCDAGTDALTSSGDALDTVFIVVTPERLDQVAPYEQLSDRLGLDTYLVVNHFEEDDRDRLVAFDGPDFAEYVYEDERIAASMSTGEILTLDEWTMETIPLEALQSERMELTEAIGALDSGRRSVVNVEVESEASSIGVARAFRRHGYAADFFRCNCRCHDGHVIARTRTLHSIGTEQERDQP